jgi:hypothetical protein
MPADCTKCELELIIKNLIDAGVDEAVQVSNGISTVNQGTSDAQGFITMQIQDWVYDSGASQSWDVFLAFNCDLCVATPFSIRVDSGPVPVLVQNT